MERVDSWRGSIRWERRLGEGKQSGYGRQDGEDRQGRRGGEVRRVVYSIDREEDAERMEAVDQAEKETG